jgi:hypothetical protein
MFVNRDLNKHTLFSLILYLKMYESFYSIENGQPSAIFSSQIIEECFFFRSVLLFFSKLKEVFTNETKLEAKKKKEFIAKDTNLQAMVDGIEARRNGITIEEARKKRIEKENAMKKETLIEEETEGTYFLSNELIREITKKVNSKLKETVLEVAGGTKKAMRTLILISKQFIGDLSKNKRATLRKLDCRTDAPHLTCILKMIIQNRMIDKAT